MRGKKRFNAKRGLERTFRSNKPPAIKIEDETKKDKVGTTSLPYPDSEMNIFVLCYQIYILVIVIEDHKIPNIL